MENYVYEHRGDSMSPNIINGDRLLCKKVDIGFFLNGLYLVEMKNDLNAVRLVSDEGDCIRLRTYDRNPDCSQTVKKDFVRGLYKVIALCRMLELE